MNSKSCVTTMTRLPTVAIDFTIDATSRMAPPSRPLVGLVEKHHAFVPSKRAGDGQTLLLPARKRHGMSRLFGFETEAPQRIVDAPF